MPCHHEALSDLWALQTLELPHRMNGKFIPDRLHTLFWRSLVQLLELGNQPRPWNKAPVLLACTIQVLRSAEIGLGNTHACIFSRLDLLPD